MAFHRKALLGVVMALVLAFATAPLFAQSTTTGSITGTVTDASKAVVPGATVTLSHKGTGAVITTTTNSAGIYSFASVTPGEYTLRCTAKGFTTAEIARATVEVTKAYTYDLTLTVGQTTTTVEVTVAPGAELQTQDASIGTVFSGDALLLLPQQQRSITALILLQPGVSPSRLAGDDVNGGQVNGATSDQTTFYVDGGDATSDLEGTNGYVSPPGEPQPAPFIAVPAEWTQEFRVVTASPTASFARSQGGEVSVVTKSGTNSFHGSAYEYYYGDATSANSWENDSLTPVRNKPHSVNNRFGGSGGGYIIKDKLFFYGGYEQRDFFASTNITQLVPTAIARSGIAVAFPGGVATQYNFNPANGALAANCGPAANMPCDPRGIGVSPVILADMALDPLPNNCRQGDGTNQTCNGNSAGYTQSYAEPILEKLAVGKLDYTLSPRWSMFGTFHFNKYNLTKTNQFNITCATANCATGADNLISTTPAQPRLATFQVNGTIGSNFTSQTHGSYLHDWWNWNRATLAPQVAGTAAAIDLGGEARIAGTSRTSKVFGDPINFDTQDARARIWGGKDWFLAQDASWLHGKHNLQFGGGYYLWNLYHQRTDDVVGGLTNGPQFYVGETNGNNGGAFLSPFSGGLPTPQGLSSTQLRRFSNVYATLLGLTDRSAQIGVRDGNFLASPLGSQLFDRVRTHNFDTYFQDTWKMTPNITFTYGVNYGVSFAPHEQTGKQVVEVFASDNQPVQNVFGYFAQRNNALSNGQFFASGLTPTTDATFGFSPINHIPALHGSAVRTQFNEFGPRLALAWNVPYKNWLFGNKQTVVRGGYSLQWNRTSAVGEVLTPLLGDGLATVQSCLAPVIAGTCSGATTNAATAFRIGTDGNGSTILPPAPTNSAIPLVPGSPFTAKSGTEDPGIHTPYSHVVSLDIQRAFAHNWLIDIGAIGRFSKNGWGNQDINAVDLNAKTPPCNGGAAGCIVGTNTGQTLAQAYNAINAGVAGPQPFFENAPFGCAGCTALAAMDAGDVSLYSFMAFNYDLVAPRPLDNLQFENGGSDNITTDHNQSNYGAGFITVRKAFSQGLDMTFNYTWSHALGTSGQNFLNQEYTAFAAPTPFDIFSGYGSNNGDRRQVLNVSFYYLLPFGKGRQYATGNNIMDRVIGGWYVSGIYTFETGLPFGVSADGDYGSPDGFTFAEGATQFGHTGAFHINNGAGCTVGCASNLNIFANPAAVLAAYQAAPGGGAPQPGVNGRPNAETFRLPSSTNMDFAIGKNVWATEKYKLTFDAQFYNLANHPNFATDFSVSPDLFTPSNFGSITNSSNTNNLVNNGARVVQLGLRFDF